MSATLPEFVGNPDLSFEMSNAFEAGFTSQAGPAHALDVSVFNNAQSYLPSVYRVSMPPDVGLTYGVSSQAAQRTVRNRGSLETMGISVTLRRRTAGPVSYTANYVWQRSADIGGSPDFVAEVLTTGEDYNNAAEYLSTRNRTHSVNAVLSWQWRQSMAGRRDILADALLRNSRTVVTVSAASGGQGAASRRVVCADNTACPAISGGILGTGALVHLFYARALSTAGPQWAFILRVRNLLNASDGSGMLTPLAIRLAGAAGTPITLGPREVSHRRVLTGLSVRF
jgi:hypothetical protein